MSEAIWRPMEKADIVVVKEIHQRQMEQIGKEIPWPDPTKPNVFMAAVCQKYGRILGTMFLESEVEIQLVTDTPEFMLELHRAHEGFEESVRRRKFKMLRAYVPVAMKEKQADYMRLMGFKDTTEEYVSYAKAL